MADNSKKNFKYYAKYIWQHKIIILSYFASVYLIFYTIYSFNDKLRDYLIDYENIIKYFSQVSILIFTSGVFAASLKYLQLLDIFKEQFQNYIESSKFDEKLKNNLKLITFSDEYLTQQNNLPTLWKQITLCMYKREFPSLYDKISKKIRNDFFVKSNISYYYKNFQINYHLEKHTENSIKIIERSSYTIVRPNDEEFSWDFAYTGNKNDNFKDEIKFNINVLTTGLTIEADIQNSEEIGDDFIIKIHNNLTGHQEYHIERHFEIIQNIDIDRVRVFGSDRIIDDLSFKVTTDEFVKATAHFIGKNKFYHNGTFDETTMAYINRDVFLPGQKFFLVFTL